MPRPQMGSSEALTIEHKPGSLAATSTTNSRIPTPADSRAIKIRQDNTTNSTNRTQQAIRVSPFGTAKLPIPREHLQELDEEFGRVFTKKVAPNNRQIPSSSTQKTLNMRARLSAATKIQDKAEAAVQAEKSLKQDSNLENSDLPLNKKSAHLQPKNVPTATSREVKELEQKQSEITVPTAKKISNAQTPAPNDLSDPKTSKTEHQEPLPAISPTPTPTSIQGTTETISLPQMAQEEVEESVPAKSDFWAKLPHSRQALVYEVIIALGLLALLLISVWYRIEKEHNKNNLTK